MTCPVCEVDHLIAVPCVHSNGTSAGELLAQLDAAVGAVEAAIKAVAAAAPNGRDYYPNNTRQRAIKEHCLRQGKLVEVATELVRMREHVQEVMSLRGQKRG